MSDPSDPTALKVQIVQQAPSGQEPGIHVVSLADLKKVGQNFVSEQLGFKWTSVEGSSYKWGGNFQFELTAGLNHAVTVGYKTHIDVSKYRVTDIGTYANFMLGAKYELIRPSKVETVGAKKTDDLTKASRYWKFGQGNKTHATTNKRKGKQREFKEIVKILAERTGAKLEETVKAWQDKIDAQTLKAKEVVSKINTLKKKAKEAKEQLDKLEEDMKKVKIQSKEYTRKSDGMKAAFNSALEIKSSESSLRGKMVTLDASVQEFMGNLIKLGE